MNSNLERLNEMLGFDASKKEGISNSVFKNALSKIENERKMEAELRAEDLLRKALELVDQATKIDREYQKSKQKVDKELGRILGQLNQGSNENGSRQEPAEEETESAET